MSDSWLPEALRGILPKSVRDWNPQTLLGDFFKSIAAYLPQDLQDELVDRMAGTMVCESSLGLDIIRFGGKVEHLGIVSRKEVTADAVLWIASSMAAVASYDITSMKFHGLGTGSNAEAATDTILQTELTTQYTPANTRATGSVAAAASGNNATYTTVGTNTIESAGVAVMEHGIFNRAANGARVAVTNLLLDRSEFSVINLSIGDGLQSTYVLTLNSGG